MVKQISDNEIYLLIKYIKSICWRVVKRLSYIQDARCLKVKDETGDLVTDCNSILARCRNCFPQLFNVHGVNDVRQTEIHTAEPLVPECSALDIELAVQKLKGHKSPSIDQRPAELI
jgi:hypothetical protein